MVTQYRLPDGWGALLEGGGGRASRGAEVVARERLPVGRKHVHVRAVGRAPRCAAVVACERMPVGRVDVRVRGEGGHLEMLQWARANGCPWDKKTCEYAGEIGTTNY